MKNAIFTLYEGNYHLGVGALVNSAIRSGFMGRFFVGYRDVLPPWVESLEQSAAGVYTIEGCEVVFFHCDPPRHLTYHKPFVAQALMEQYADIERLFYADPDVLLLAPWAYFESWVASGVALCLDSNFPFVGLKHPWRCQWRSMIESAGLTEAHANSKYYNAGFFGVGRAHASLLQNWVSLTLHFEQSGGESSKMDTGNFLKSVRSDQELLAAACMTYTELSELGLEGMGFNGHYCILSHAVESPKPWNRAFLKLSLSGVVVSQASQLYLRHSQGPISLFSKGEFRRKWWSLRVAQLINRFYSKKA